MKNNLPSQTIFYSIEKTIKEYRRFAQNNIYKQFNDITVDQGLILQFLNCHADLTQIEIGKLIFKDNASVTRMIELMVRKGYLSRSVSNADRRKSNIEITFKGKNIIDKLEGIILANREKALRDISEGELVQLKNTLNKIINNCKHL